MMVQSGIDMVSIIISTESPQSEVKNFSNQKYSNALIIENW